MIVVSLAPANLKSQSFHGQTCSRLQLDTRAYALTAQGRYAMLKPCSRGHPQSSLLLEIPWQCRPRKLHDTMQCCMRQLMPRITPVLNT